MASRKNDRDRDALRIRRLLSDAYGRAHPGAAIDVYRSSPVSIRIRIVDHDFDGQDRVDREDAIWPIIEKLPNAILEQITVILLLTPREQNESWASKEFDDPLPSAI
jgi:stress-induced morphogen